MLCQNMEKLQSNQKFVFYVHVVVYYKGTQNLEWFTWSIQNVQFEIKTSVSSFIVYNYVTAGRGHYC